MSERSFLRLTSVPGGGWVYHQRMEKAEHLKIDPTYRPIEARTRFSFAADLGSFARATERCVGVAKCRNTHGGVMCPSFRVTQEEKHSTRGRVRLLEEGPIGLIKDHPHAGHAGAEAMLSSGQLNRHESDSSSA